VFEMIVGDAEIDLCLCLNIVILEAFLQRRVKSLETLGTWENRQQKESYKKKNKKDVLVR
jgi:hypothetical protein